MRSSRPSSGGAGFTLTELIIALFVMIEVIIAVLLLFDSSNKLSRTQTHVADLQQSMRIAQYELVRNTRMAGRGGLPVRGAFGNAPIEFYDGSAIGVVNHASDDLGILTGPASATNPKILPGTDVLRLRGVFSGVIYQLNSADSTSFEKSDENGDGLRTITVNRLSPAGVPQDLKPLADLILAETAVPEALIVTSPLDDTMFVVVELDPGNSLVVPAGSSDPDQVVLAYQFDPGTGTHTAAYRALSNPTGHAPGAGLFPDAMGTAAFLGVLEEYRFYIREEYATPGDNTTELSPRLSRARVFPGTNVAYESANNLRSDIADNMWDLQVALALDANGDGALTETAAASDTDEWLFNFGDDDPLDPEWSANVGAPLYYLQLSTLGLTDRRDRNYQAPLIGTLEDHGYTSPPHPLNTSPQNRMYRHRVQRTLVDLRNL
jgi:hypothetical protein